ncbi:hypothetical protein KL905_002025 [Ogataea polymorpha]|uniref:uncharacterized protein n=1 Tax=Ogataea polymorpha TaxID=460523 RepID=UPI0007F343B4|nr:uncharacterized protein OGAPODRAFT_14107 [Ogataea polymorpha]KAG7881109.1 hypothetical protein KL937_001956 [Ogataea polymorpha]KAG7893847.1 hypothetical protein KL908_002901 [Ogataea polymorpha]KAG7901470.1 hypothetical protein KL935_002536 [Ogataea polymorpha]KAG7917245.1 hypothetical protein KL927_003019 [Ogataea polymorpha]KAG7922003.1 hypothetical protein KL905_002025 [Ogataea polymorpha]
MTLTDTWLPQISGVFNGARVSLVKKPLAKGRIVRGKEYPIAFDLVVEGSSSYQEAVNDFFEELSQKGVLLDLVKDHGLVIIQNLKSTNPEHYSQIVNRFFHSSDYQEFDQVGLLATRQKIDNAVSSVGNDDELGKNVNKLHAHQEFSRYLEYPHILTFFAQQASVLGGGESTTTHATELFDVVNSKYPEFIKDLYEKNGNHVYQKFSYEVSTDSKFKISWTDKGAFGRYITDEDLKTKNLESMKVKAIKLAHEKVSKNVEFDDNHDLIVHQQTSIVNIHPHTGLPIIFSSLPTYYSGYYQAKLRGEKATLPPLRYGNGDPIPENYLDYLFEQSVKLEYSHRFEDGDLLFLDNFAVYHGRNPYTAGDRKILASFWEPSTDRRKPYRPSDFTELFA